MSHTLIFDIGKTNKKCFLFDENYQEVWKEYSRPKEIKDEDGFPCDDINAIGQWIKETYEKVLNHPGFELDRVNFSTYGASFVHLDNTGKPLTPLYNYLKPYPQKNLDSFYDKYGDKDAFAIETASPSLGMLNSDLQLYWLKYAQPGVFEKIHWSLHFPQYASYLISGNLVSDFTSIGCHTGLWDFENKDYHHWVYAEGIDRILPPVVDTTTSVQKTYQGKEINVGVGIHDSSAALLPYIFCDEEPFLLLSTGTWSIALNPFNTTPFTIDELNQDCLNYMRVDGGSVKAARLFLGNEYEIWIKALADFFNQPIDQHKKVKLDPNVLEALNRFQNPVFQWQSIAQVAKRGAITDLSQFNTYEEAYHKLVQELVDLQVDAIKLAIGKTALKKVYIDGGFVGNQLFIRLLAQKLPDFELITNKTPLGSALGAAMAISDEAIDPEFMLKNFSFHPRTTIPR